MTERFAKHYYDHDGLEGVVLVRADGHRLTLTDSEARSLIAVIEDALIGGEVQ